MMSENVRVGAGLTAQAVRAGSSPRLPLVAIERCMLSANVRVGAGLTAQLEERVQAPAYKGCVRGHPRIFSHLYPI